MADEQQQETRKGRAELKLAERASLWTARPEPRHLPSLGEWIRIRTLTEKSKWTEPQQQMMRTAGRLHVLRTSAVMSVLVILIVAGFAVRSAVNEQATRSHCPAACRRPALGQHDTGRHQHREPEGLPRMGQPDLLQQSTKPRTTASDAELHAALALVTVTADPDPQVLEFLTERLLTVKPSQLGPVRELLQPHQDTLVPFYWNLALDNDETASRRFHAACVWPPLIRTANESPLPTGNRSPGGTLRSSRHSWPSNWSLWNPSTWACIRNCCDQSPLIWFFLCRPSSAIRNAGNWQRRSPRLCWPITPWISPIG
jgi:hypothetical protein